MLRAMLPAAIIGVRREKFSWISACALTLVLLVGFWPMPAAARSHSHAPKAKQHSAAKRSTSRNVSRRHGGVRSARYSRRSSRSSRRARGQQAISQDRTLEIQRALIRQHYLAPGQDTGEWDQTTRDALVRFQGDNHWQTKILPDSRALIKLGLGPSRENLLNPESAAIGMPGWPARASAAQDNGVNSSQAVAN